jgi:hypothetical protein
MADIDIEKLAAAGSMAATGGYAQAALGGLQAIYGLAQLPKARAEFERARAAAPSLETPSQFYENYKNAYDSSLAAMQNDAIQANLATSVQALQGAGGRALVGGLTQATAQAQAAQNQMLAQERQMRLAAGQQLAAAQERTIGRKETRSQQEMAYANQAYQAALGNIGGGLGAVGEGLMYGMSAVKAADKTPKPEVETQVSPKQETMDFVKESRDLIGKEMGGTIGEARAAVAEAYKPSILQTPQFNKKIPETPTLMRSRSVLGQDYGKAITPQPQPSPYGSTIPLEYRNNQAIKQLEALQKGYDMVTEYNKYFFNGGMMTGGAFNHATNPIDLVQNGQKIGEATGGEYILNPSQAAAVAKQSSYARKLFKMFEKNAKKNK